MDNKEILKKATQKAIDGGWNPLNFRDELDKRYKGVKVLDIEYYDSAILMFYEIGKGDSVYRGDVRLGVSDYDIIFDHDFAKALWGEEDAEVHEEGVKKEPYHLPIWQVRLRQMVIAEDPIKYLGENT